VRSVFLGDAHLRPDAGQGHRDLVGFLDELVADQLFVMGDLFDFLYGVKGMDPGPVAGVLAALGRLAASGTPVAYLEGNHDFHLGPVLPVGVEPWPGPRDVDLGPVAAHVAHGDEIQRRDLGYALLRPLVRTEPVAAAIRVLGPSRLHRIGRLSAKTSRHMRAGRSRNWRAEKLRYVRQQAARGRQLVILGHSHQLFFEPVGEALCVQVGRFDVRRQHVVLDGRRVELREGDRVVVEAEI
jgi:UDP-2,3-diacylglucosamine hydrolase